MKISHMPRIALTSIPGRLGFAPSRRPLNRPLNRVGRLQKPLWLLGLLGLLGLHLSVSAQGGSAPERPNIIMILSDDHGSGDFAFRGGSCETPHLDHLFNEGRTLNRFYTQPQCTPTRAAFLTGRYPARFGMHYGVVLPHSEWGLPTTEVMLPEILREEGYATAMIGKWHVGHANEAMLPENRGFDYFYGMYNGSLDYFTHQFPGNRGHDLHENRQPVYPEGYATEIFGDQAVRYIQARDAEKPFFLYLSFNAPHDPWQAPEPTIRKYEQRGIERTKAIYLAMVEEMDTAIGRVLAALAERGMEENTLVVFASDNGGPYAPQITSNGLQRGEKGTTYEGGIHVPAVAVWKGQIPSRSSSDELVYIGDLFPTFVHLAQGAPERQNRLDSYNITDTLLHGAASPRQRVIQVTGPATFWNGVITDRWKLVVSVHDQQVASNQSRVGVPANHALYDLSVDPYEQNDVSADHLEVYQYLLKQWYAVYDQRVKSDFSYSQARGDDPEIWGQFE